MSEKSKSALPNDPEAQVYKRPPQYYNVWQDGEGIPVHKTFHVESLFDVDVAPLERFGGNCCFNGWTIITIRNSFIFAGRG